MLVDQAVLPVLAVLTVATLIRSAFGFGEALVSVPLLALIMPVDVAAPLAVLVSITVAPGGHPNSPTCGHLKIPHP